MAEWPTGLVVGLVAVQIKGLGRRVDEPPQRRPHTLGVAQDGRQYGLGELADFGLQLGDAPIELGGVALQGLDAEQVLVDLDFGFLEGAHKVADALLPDAARAAGREVEEGTDRVEDLEALGEGGFALRGVEVGGAGDEAVDAGADGGDVADDFVEGGCA